MTAAQASMNPRTDTARAQFDALLAKHRRIAFKVANTYVRDPQDRADLAQEIAAQAWHAFHAFDPQRSFSTWLYRIALNVAISFSRSLQRRERHGIALDEELHDVAVEPTPADEERVRALYRVIDTLGALDRALLLLYLDERSYVEIAEILGITETNVATKISRLKQRIRADLADA
jgi:RNA polymerase sigma factor (sigma-70 family)